MFNLFFFSFTFVAFISLSSAGNTPAYTCETPIVRKEWRSLGYDGQKAYADAIKCLSELPHNVSLTPTGATPGIQPIMSNSSRYDDVVYTHMDATDSAHFTGRFLPWHRLYLHTMENLLRNECNYPGYMTYWDWTLDSHDIEHSPIFNSDPFTGLGVFPNASTNFELADGAFCGLIRAYPTPHPIQRNYNLRPWEQSGILPFVFNRPEREANETQTTSEYIKLTTNFAGNFTAFQAYLDGHRTEGLHPAAHASLGGDMLNITHSPNDPIFFLLHTQIDRVWAAWQAYDPRNRYATGGGVDQDLDNFDEYPLGNGTPVTPETVIYMSNLGPDAQVKDVLDIQGGLLCYEYAT